MRISDWSSDVCSSDLVGHNALKQWPEFLEIIAFLTVRDLFGRALFRTRAYVTQLGDVVFSVLLEAELGQKRAIIEFARNLPHRFGRVQNPLRVHRSEEHTSELQSLMRISYAVFCLKKKITSEISTHNNTHTTVTSHITHY